MNLQQPCFQISSHPDPRGQDFAALGLSCAPAPGQGKALCGPSLRLGGSTGHLRWEGEFGLLGVGTIQARRGPRCSLVTSGRMVQERCQV